MDDFPDDIQLDDEPFEPFDDYEAFADEMMEQAERADQWDKQQQSSSIPSSTLATAAATPGPAKEKSHGLGELPAQRDYLAILNAHTQQTEREVELNRQQRQSQMTGGAGTGTNSNNARNGNTKKGGGWNRPIGSTGNAPVEGDGAAPTINKKRQKRIRLDAEKLLGPQGYPMLIAQGKRFRIRDKYRTSAEKDSNSRKNLAELMIVYQTWAHNLFPKSTFRDFINEAESISKSDKQIKATMTGWRDAYWDEARAKQSALDEIEETAKEAEDRMNSVWDAHAAERSQRSRENMEQDPFLVTEKGDGQPSSSNWSFGDKDSVITTTGGSKPSHSQSRAISSKKGKGRLVDNPSAAMRLQISDDENEGDRDDYEVTLSRMRDSMNLNSKSPVAQKIINKKSRSEAEAMDEDPQESSSRISGNDFSVRAGSVFDEEEEDDEPPLFTHRALQMIGGLTALEERQRAEVSEKMNNNLSEKASIQRATLSSDEEDTLSKPFGQSNPSPVNLSLGSEWGTDNGNSLFGEFTSSVKERIDLSLNDGEDEDIVIAQRRPKARKALILEDSDDE
ncbi:hypothetical protein FBU30_000981 [Linnemannia zychae]|nr:hypothetical protein FBU30_000981 [Linnemannia zychae]